MYTRPRRQLSLTRGVTNLNERLIMTTYSQRQLHGSTYAECAFYDCDRIPAADLGFPLCPKHCRIVYLNIKDLLENATPEPTNHSNGRARPLASKRIGTVYFARIGDLIKIGYTTRLTQRMKDLRAEVLVTMPGTMGTEKALHAKFGPLWERGELFRPEPELMDYIASIAV